MKQFTSALRVLIRQIGLGARGWDSQPLAPSTRPAPAWVLSAGVLEAGGYGLGGWGRGLPAPRPAECWGLEAELTSDKLAVDPLHIVNIRQEA